MPDLFEWTAKDKYGQEVTYQTSGPSSCSELAMLEHLQIQYPHLTITAIDRVPDSDYRPATGIIARHAFTHGIVDRVEEALGRRKFREFGDGLLDYAKRVAKQEKPSDTTEFGVELQKSFDQAVAEARQRIEDAARRPLLGVGRSLI
jgi:hypothetical protein